MEAHGPRPRVISTLRTAVDGFGLTLRMRRQKKPQPSANFMKSIPSVRGSTNCSFPSLVSSRSAAANSSSGFSEKSCLAFAFRMVRVQKAVSEKRWICNYCVKKYFTLRHKVLHITVYNRYS